MNILSSLSLLIIALSQNGVETSSDTNLPTNDLTLPPEIGQPIDTIENIPNTKTPLTNIEETTIPASTENPPLVFEGKSDQIVTQALVDYLQQINTLSGEFYQQAPSGNFSQGDFYIRRPGLLRFEYAPPTPLLIVANGGTMFVHDSALKTTDSYPITRTPLKYLLRKKIDLTKADITKIERGIDAVAITLAPKASKKPNEEEADGELTLIFSVNESSQSSSNDPKIELIRWVVRDARDGQTIVDLANVEQDKKLNNNLFRIPETQSPFLKD